MIAQSAQAGILEVGWDQDPDADVAGYTLFFGTTSGTYTASIDCGASTTCIASNLTEGQRYYFAVQAYTTSGLRSPLSLEVSAVVPLSGTPAALTAPAQGSVLPGSSVQFQWSAGTNVSDYKLSVGTTLGGTTILDQDEGSSLSANVTGLPTNGSAVYVRLWSLISGVWNFTDYTFTSFTTSPTLTASPTPVQAGATITVSIANGPGNAGDWVAMVPSTAADGAYIAWAFLTGTTIAPPATGLTAATLHFTAPQTAGTYNFRFFANNSFAKLATSATLTVVAPLPSVTASATTVNAGAPFSVTLANGPGNPTDWVALYQAGAANTAYMKWQFMNGSTIPPASGAAGATLQFVAPSTPGTYVVRWLSNNTFTTIASSPTITVLPPPPPSVTVSATTVNAGASFSVTLANGPGNPMDWVGLYQAGAANTAYMKWQFMNGSTIPPASGAAGATLQFVAPSTPGTYVVLWLSNNTFTTIASSPTITVLPPPPPSVTPSATTVNAGSLFTVTLANGPANSTDWAGLYSTAAGDGGYMAWSFMNGSYSAPGTGMAGATLQFVAPMTPGTYNVRWFANNSFSELATSATITVQPPPPPVISLSATTVARGGSFTVTLADGPGNAADWVALIPASAPNGAYISWKFMNGTTFVPASGVSGATLAFTAPTTPGTYNIRWFSNNTFTLLATSVTITVP